MFPQIRNWRKKRPIYSSHCYSVCFVSLSIATTMELQIYEQVGDVSIYKCIYVRVCSAEWCFCCWLMNLLKPVAWHWEKLEKCNTFCDGAAYIFRFSFYFSWWWCWLYDLYTKLLHSVCHESGSTPQNQTKPTHTHAYTQSYFSNCSVFSHCIVCINMVILSERFTN